MQVTEWAAGPVKPLFYPTPHISHSPERMVKTIRGGWHWPAKMFCYKKPIEDLPRPERLSLPLWRGGKASVFPGDWVHACDIIGYDQQGLPVYAPLAGQVEQVENFNDLAARPKGYDVARLTVHLQVSQAQHPPEAVLEPRPRYWEMTRRELGGRIWEAGIRDLQEPPDLDLLVFNGLDLEPPLSVRTRLLAEQPEKLIEGMRILMQLHGSGRARLALSADLPELAERMRVLLTSSVNLSVVEMPPRYPQGHPRLLKEAFPEHPRSGVYGLEEVWNVRQAVMEGRPLTDKLCTVWDQTSGQTNVLRLPLGITAEQVFRRDLSRYRSVKLIMGGLLSGRGVFSPQTPVGPECDGLILMKDEVAWEGSLCANCGECVNLCPRGLSPQLIYRAVEAGDKAALEVYRAGGCIECGLCSFVCPARLHLLHQIKTGKALLNGAPVPGQTVLDTP